MRIHKYVINDEGLPIIFSIYLLHSSIQTNVVSAGFVIVDYDCEKELFSVRCYGKSSDLKIKSNPNDFKIIEHYLNESKEEKFHLFIK